MEDWGLTTKRVLVATDGEVPALLLSHAVSDQLLHAFDRIVGDYPAK